MADINVKTTHLKDCAARINQSSGELRRLADRVDSVRKSLRGEIAAESMLASHLAQIAGQMRSTSDRTGAMQGALNTIASKYEATERGIAADASGGIIRQSLSDAQDKTTKTFSGKRKEPYGADQGDMSHSKKGMWFFGYRWFEDEDLYDFIRQRYPNYSQTQIAELMDRINKEGCGYVALVNNIFVEYEGREAEFERVFGFPMYDEKGNPNYNYLLVDIYCETDDRYFLDEPYGSTALVNDVIISYTDRKGGAAEFKRIYGVDPLTDDNMINPAAAQAILDRYQHSSTVILKTEGTTTYSLTNRFNHYMQEHGVNHTYRGYVGSDVPSTSQVKKYIDSGKNVNIAVGDFNLYKKDGSVARKDVGNHWMTVTGVTKDGRYIVSSWGDRYYINPSELNNPTYLVTDIKAS